MSWLWRCALLALAALATAGAGAAPPVSDLSGYFAMPLGAGSAATVEIAVCGSDFCGRIVTASVLPWAGPTWPPQTLCGAAVFPRLTPPGLKNAAGPFHGRFDDPRANAHGDVFVYLEADGGLHVRTDPVGPAGPPIDEIWPRMPPPAPRCVL